MNLFDIFTHFFAKISKEPALSFGRYSDAYKTDEQHRSLEEATTAFEKADYHNACLRFFDYLQDATENNLFTSLKNNELHFELFQGSKRITGIVTHDFISAQTIMAEAQSLPVSLMRRLLELNFQLRYCRFALQNNSILIKFDTQTQSGPPAKLYFALKELATTADRQDDVLLSEFSTLKPADTEHITHIPDKEKATKYKFFQQWIQNTLAEVRRLDPNIFARGIAYMLLNLAYKIDYLLLPQGTVMDAIERLQTNYFNPDDGAQPVEKNAQMIAAFEKMLIITPQQFNQQLYRTKTTFGITGFTTPAQVVDIIDQLLQDAKEFKRRNQLAIANSVLEYIMQYCMFQFGMPPCIRKTLHLGIRILNSSFFKELDFPVRYYDADANVFDKTAIKRYLRQTITDAQKQYPHFDLNLRHLNYHSPSDFVYTLLVETANCNYTDK
ncbi:MAG TPA: hypothetical protein PK239_07020 [Chitinophagales bacterium]|nr:hypothetical protein [Chitinophagales bacterium]